MGTAVVRFSLGIACLAFGVSALAYSATQIPRPSGSWTQFRLRADNNAVLAGTLETSWRIHTGGAFSSSPALVGGTLYADDNAGNLYALDVANGKTRWHARVANPLMSAPIVYGNLVIVGEGDENSPQGSSPSHPIRVGAPPSALLAFDRATGQQRWRVPLEGSGMPSPAVVDGMLVHHNGAGYVLGVKPETGQVLYRRNLHSIASMVAALPVGGGRFVTSGIDPNAVWLLSGKNGSVVWRSNLSPLASGIGDCPPAGDGQRIYCTYVMPPTSAVPIQTEREAVLRLYAIDLKTGKRVWDVQLDKGILPKRNEAAIPLVDDGTLFVGSSLQPEVHAVDPRTGAIKWRQTTRGPVKGGMAAVGGAVYFGDLGGYLWALDESTGKVIGDKNMGTPFNVGSPIVAGKTLIIGSQGGTLAAVPLRDIRSGADR